jgi:tRNA-Thr(GGU) m(6)t(6)A37 methyltransferase TsaA
MEVIHSSDEAPQPITYGAIGHVENDYDEPESPDTLKAAISRIALEPDLVEGLQGLTPGSKVLVIFDFHLAEGYDLLQHPRGDESRPKRGVFALRSPFRPNHIGITEVELLAVENNVLSMRGLDAINGTPVLDIKPAG